ncbi:hypothetical protein KQI89_10955 [Clostridium sp. MSJ-4]|uniref:Bacterial Pleckstrin homology domain-containing protein n=1 Tax=Clostridium simiarum TaxID=2841506 RepID=A0ABS6F409_9CLOT|nr:hypothetical protein [Clostridium simiarum]MBU5592282.1 hypothetical protein [Clostridium simiarum]
MYNMNTITIYLSLFFLYCLSLFIYKIEKKSIFFGVRLPYGYNEKEKLAQLKREYRRNFTVSYVFIILIYIVLTLRISEIWSVVLGNLFVFIEIMVIYANYYKIHKKVKALKETENWKVVIKDETMDDENYIMGFIYYNKKNPALWAFSKEEGRLLSLNFARPLGKVLGVAIVGICIIASVRTLTFPSIFKGREVDVIDNQIIIEGQWGITVNKEEINKVSLEKDLPNRIRRRGGASVNKMIMGKHKAVNHKEAYFYIMDKTDPFVAIYTNDNKLIVINYENVSETEDLYRSLDKALN